MGNNFLPWIKFVERVLESSQFIFLLCSSCIKQLLLELLQTKVEHFTEKKNDCKRPKILNGLIIF